jgi:hypothetical protein
MICHLAAEWLIVARNPSPIEFCLMFTPQLFQGADG